jgi:hypothetical protein
MSWLRDSATAAAAAPLFCLLGAFLVTFLLTRGITCLIRAQRGIFSDLSIGPQHLHHMVWGVALVLIAGTSEFAFTPDESWNALPALVFGAGAALLLDEFALIIYMRDVYWSEEGRRSIDAVITMVIIVGMLAIPIGIAPGFLPATSRPFYIAFVLAYISAMALALLKGKLFTAILGLILPPVLLIGAFRLARPQSPWARLRYAHNSSKQLRSAARYQPGSAHERRRQRLLNAMGGTLPQIVGASSTPGNTAEEA